MQVKIGKLPGQVNEFELDANTTVEEALEIAGLSSEGFGIRVNGSDASDSTTLHDNDKLLLVKKVQGA